MPGPRSIIKKIYIKEGKARESRDADRDAAAGETAREREAVKVERLGVNKMSSVIRLPVLKAFVVISYFRGSN